METTLLLLQARGDVVYDREHDVHQAVGGHAVLGEVRTSPDAAVSVRVDVRDQGVQRAAMYRVRAELFLIEEVAEAGLHHFVFRSADRAVAWLAGTLDPYARADHPGPEQLAERLDDLDPHSRPVELTARP